MIRSTEDQLRQLPTYSPESLTQRQYHNLAAGLAGLVLNWSVDLHYDEHGKATIIIMPDDLDDAIFPTLIVRSDASAFHIEELCGDDYRELGEYQVWSDVLRAVRIRLIWAGSPQATLH